MKKYVAVLILCLTFLTFSSGFSATAGIILPNPQVIGQSLNNSISFLAHDKNSEKYPLQLVIDDDHGKIKGLKAVYDNSVSISEAERSINEHYRAWQLSGFENSPVKLWKIIPEEVVIQLSTNDDALVQIIILPFRKPVNNNSER